jgi:hypothetical protein
MRPRIAIFLAAIVVYLAVALAYARTRVPYVDEAWFSMPAWNLAAHGSMGTPVIEPTGSPLPGMDVHLNGIRSHTYWYLPLPIVVEAAWFRMLGFSVFTMRLFSTVWAVTLLAAWFVAIRRLAGSAMVAAAAVILTAADPVFLERSGFGRFDLMSCALGFAGIAAYMVLRERSLAKALLTGHALVAAAGMTHPTGGLLSFPGLLCLMIYYDRKRLRWLYLPLMAMPYLAAGAGMAIYVWQDPAAFKAQFFGITGSRLGGIRAPVSLVLREVQRYLQVYGLNPEGSALSRFKLLILAMYIAAAAALCIGREARKRYGGLLVLAGAYIAALTIFDNLKQQWYVVYIVPMFAALLAAALFNLPPAVRRPGAIAVAALCVADMASVARLTFGDGYDHVYRPMVAYLETQAGPHGVVMASSEVGLDYGLDRNIVDDIRLGCRSGKTPDLVVVETRYREAFRYFQTAEPQTAQCIGRFFQGASPLKEFGAGYTVYAAPKHQ